MNFLRIGRGCQVAGLVLIVAGSFLLLGMVPIFPEYLPNARRITCVKNLKQIGLSFRGWALDNAGQFPFNVSTNAGGTMEFCAKGADGFDGNAALHLQAMSNELTTPILLVCPKDSSRKPAAGFPSLQASNVTYRLHSGTKINESNPTAVLAFCPVDGNTLYCDGSVKVAKAGREPAWSAILYLLRDNPLPRWSRRGLTVMVIGLVLLWVGSRVTWRAKGTPKPMPVILGEAILLILAVLFIGLMLISIIHF